MTGPVVAVVVKGYPRLSETFIAKEIQGLERRGLDLRLYSLRLPTDRHVHPIHAEIRAPAVYLPEYFYQGPLRVLRSWRRVRGLPGYPRAHRTWIADLRRDPTPNRVRRFGQALVLAAEMPAETRVIYAHFLHTPASVARYAALIRGLPFAVSAHAKDIWTTPDWELREKLADAAFAVTCSGSGRARLASLAPADRVDLVYHGLDLGQWPPPPDRDDRDGPVEIVSVGRAVEKKGFSDLIAGLAKLPAAPDWRFTHIGGGPLLPAMKREAEAAGIAGRIAWRGQQPKSEVLAACRRADVFVLASRIAGDGDRDGLPNVLMEAQSQGLACVATRVSAIPEVIEDGLTGLLVEPGDADGLARALGRLVADADLRLRLGRAGHDRLRAHFDQEPELDRLAAKLRRFALSSPP
ncbi:MAG: colanic acid biosynthesis glycosyltransferase WcaL [Alphaproteobacteria bacterium]|nr:colanic acid biosynthesis glycosyltransferase WcaL [Alphaproteobacteria bacterium]